jgi:hypothetical protein
MHWQPAAVCTFLAILVVAPAHASDERESSDRPRRFSVHLGLGSQLNAGGHLQSLSVEYAPWRAVTLLVTVERDHVPSQVRRYADPARRGGTVTSISAEVRYRMPLGERLSPFIMAGRGGGISHPSVNDIFPDRVTNTVELVYAGGGIRVPLRPRLDVLVDARCLILVEGDIPIWRLPIRGGVTWRF